jgi:hypothetical protein
LDAYAELTGDEPLPNGSTPNAFGGNIFNFTSGFGPDPSKGDVNLDGTVDDADLLAILFAFGSSDAAVDVNSDGVCGRRRPADRAVQLRQQPAGAVPVRAA